MWSKTQKKLFSLLILAPLLIILILAFDFHAKVQEILQNQQAVKEFANTYPIAGRLLFLLIIILEVVIAPLPGGLLPVATGILFGVIEGTLLSWTGNVLGAILAWTLAHFFGRKLVLRLFSPERIEYYDIFISRHRAIIWILYAIPLLPIDIISFSMGLSNTRFTKFAIGVSISLLPNMIILNFLGEAIITSNLTFMFWFVGIAITVGLIATYIKEKGHKKI